MKTETTINLSILKTEEKAKTYIAFVKKNYINENFKKNKIFFYICRKKWAELFVQHFPILNKVRTTILFFFYSYFL